MAKLFQLFGHLSEATQRVINFSFLIQQVEELFSILILPLINFTILNYLHQFLPLIVPRVLHQLCALNLLPSRRIRSFKRISLKLYLDVAPVGRRTRLPLLSKHDLDWLRGCYLEHLVLIAKFSFPVLTM